MMESHVNHLCRKPSETFWILQDAQWILDPLSTLDPRYLQSGRLKLYPIDLIAWYTDGTLAAPLGNSHRLGEATQPQHSYHTKQRTRCQNGKSIAPADQIHEVRYELD